MSGLRLAGVTRNFGGIAALRGVDLSVARGELTAIIGPNGAGKSTLIGITSGEIPPSFGEVWFENRRIDGVPAYQVNRLGLARTFQAGDLYNRLTVFENAVAAAASRIQDSFAASLWRAPWPRKADRQTQIWAEEALRRVGLSDRRNDLAAVLPAGQRRLLAVARAVATGATWLLLDEPAAGLNAGEKSGLVEVLRKLHAGGATIIFIEHDMRVVAGIAQRVIVLDQGAVIADGKPEVVRQSDRVIEAYLGISQFRRPMATAQPTHTPVILEASGLSVCYGGLTAVDRVSLQLRAGEIIAILGANGAGKSSLLKAIARATMLTQGQLRYDGADIGRWSARQAVRAGVVLVPEGRELFASLTVADNLQLGAYAHINRMRQFVPDFLPRLRDDDQTDRTISEVLALFPRLAERQTQFAGTLSGGEAQMLAIGRALVSRPKLLLLDEPSLGLAPRIAAEIFEKLAELRERGLTLVIVEQNAWLALQTSDRAYVMNAGRIIESGNSAVLMQRSDFASAYLGGADEWIQASSKSGIRPKEGGKS